MSPNPYCLLRASGVSDDVTCHARGGREGCAIAVPSRIVRGVPGKMGVPGCGLRVVRLVVVPAPGGDDVLVLGAHGAAADCHHRPRHDGSGHHFCFTEPFVGEGDKCESFPVLPSSPGRRCPHPALLHQEWGMCQAPKKLFFFFFWPWMATSQDRLFG